MVVSSEQVRSRLQKAKETRERNKVSRAATRSTLEGGAQVYEDTPPGIGWVLEFPSGRKCYYKNREQAVHFWETEWKASYSKAG